MPRVSLMVVVDSDPVPGTFHTEDDVKDQVQRILDETIAHYHPNVTLLFPKKVLQDLQDKTLKTQIPFGD